MPEIMAAIRTITTTTAAVEVATVMPEIMEEVTVVAVGEREEVLAPVGVAREEAAAAEAVAVAVLICRVTVTPLFTTLSATFYLKEKSSFASTVILSLSNTRCISSTSPCTVPTTPGSAQFVARSVATDTSLDVTVIKLSVSVGFFFQLVRICKVLNRSFGLIDRIDGSYSRNEVICFYNFIKNLKEK